MEQSSFISCCSLNWSRISSCLLELVNSLPCSPPLDPALSHFNPFYTLPYHPLLDTRAPRMPPFRFFDFSFLASAPGLSRSQFRAFSGGCQVFLLQQQSSRGVNLATNSKSYVWNAWNFTTTHMNMRVAYTQ